MPQEPKKRHSRARQGKRRASIKLQLPATATCTNCGLKNMPHTVCKNCGYYRGESFIAKNVAVTPVTEPQVA